MIIFVRRSSRVAIQFLARLFPGPGQKMKFEKFPPLLVPWWKVFDYDSVLPLTGALDGGGRNRFNFIWAKI